MSLTAFGGGGNDREFENLTPGTYSGVCVDVVDLGMVESTWENKLRSQHKIRLVFQVEERMSDGRPFLVSERFTLSLSEKSKLRPLIEHWRGKAFTEAEVAAGYPLESLIGVPGIITVTQRVSSQGKTFSNVAAVSPLMKGMVGMRPTGYTRKSARETPAPTEPTPAPAVPQSLDFKQRVERLAAQKSMGPSAAPHVEVTADDIPF